MKRFIDAVLKTLGGLILILAVLAWLGLMVWCTVEIVNSDMPLFVTVVVLLRFWERRKRGADR